MEKSILVGSFIVLFIAFTVYKLFLQNRIEPEGDKLCDNCGKNSCDVGYFSNPNSQSDLSKAIPSCTLSSKELTDRGKLLKTTIFSKAKIISEMKDGYDVVFHEPIEFSTELLEFINFERNCCSGFVWGLVFEPHYKAIHLQIYGSQQVKREMLQGFIAFGLASLIKN